MEILKQRIAVILVTQTLLAILNHFAHQHIDRLWQWTDNTVIIILFIALPLLGGWLLWTRLARIGGIIVLGTLPASFLFNIEVRYFLPQYVALVLPISQLWNIVYNVTYVLLLVVQIIGTWFALKVVRMIHASLSEPAANL